MPVEVAGMILKMSIDILSILLSCPRWLFKVMLKVGLQISLMSCFFGVVKGEGRVDEQQYSPFCMNE